MDLLSMLNDDDSKAPATTPSSTHADRPNPASTSNISPQDGHQSRNDESLPRKRQRVEDPPSPSSVALPKPAPPLASSASSATAATAATSATSAVSPQQTSKQVTQPAPGSRNNSITALSEPGSLEPSIINVQPSEELTRFVSDFIFLNLNEQGYENLEIEAKLGRIINVQTNERLRLGVQTETVIFNDLSEFGFHTRFESNMTEKQHKNFNQYLNKAFMDSRAHSNGSAGPSKQRRVPLDYTHTKQIDSTFQNPNENPRTAKKIRVTTNAQGEVLDTIIKENLGHLNIFSPKTAFDWRISINNERKGSDALKLYLLAGGVPKGVELVSERRKDRLTYIHQHCQVDLTQVINPAEKEKTHELEVELRDIEALRMEAENAKMGKASKYADMVRVFVDNVRLLARVQQA